MAPFFPVRISLFFFSPTSMPSFPHCARIPHRWLSCTYCFLLSMTPAQSLFYLLLPFLFPIVLWLLPLVPIFSSLSLKLFFLFCQTLLYICTYIFSCGYLLSPLLLPSSFPSPELFLFHHEGERQTVHFFPDLLPSTFQHIHIVCLSLFLPISIHALCI
jgi:hypothetical protein